jgi:hypothetical protein
MNNLSQRTKLELAVKDAQSEVILAQKTLAAKRTELSKAEDQLINTREARIRAEESLRTFDAANDLLSTRDDLRDVEIDRFRDALPKALLKIQDEPKLKYIRVGDLETV